MFPLALVVASVSPWAWAGELSCQALEGLIAEARSDFSDRAAAGAEAAPAFQGAANCAVTRSLSGGAAFHCFWAYPYRVPEALAAFEAFDRSIRACLADRAVPDADAGVNHPDFYDLRLYRMDHATVSVSIKDKSALERTYLFVRVQSEPPD